MTDADLCKGHYHQKIIAWGILLSRGSYITVAITPETERKLMKGDKFIAIVPAETGWIGTWTDDGEFVDLHFFSDPHDEYEEYVLPPKETTSKKDKKIEPPSGYL